MSGPNLSLSGLLGNWKWHNMITLFRPFRDFHHPPDLSKCQTHFTASKSTYTQQQIAMTQASHCTYAQEITIKASQLFPGSTDHDAPLLITTALFSPNGHGHSHSHSHSHKAREEKTTNSATATHQLRDRLSSRSHGFNMSLRTGILFYPVPSYSPPGLHPPPFVANRVLAPIRP